jgi:predicted GIY-YIG superfamily endonuclease
MAKTYQLYRHYDKAGTLLYVGVALCVLRRTIGHRTGAKWFLDIATITVEHYADRRTALEAELAAIKAESPKHNVHKNRRARWPETAAHAQASNGSAGA